MTAPRQRRATLGPRERLHGRRQFRAVYACRARAGDGRIVAYARPNGTERTRLGLSVGRRCGTAVQRNRTKRLLREAFRQARAEFPPGYDVVLVPLGRDYTFEEVDRRLRVLVPEAMRRAGRKRRGGKGGPNG